MTEAELDELVDGVMGMDNLAPPMTPFADRLLRARVKQTVRVILTKQGVTLVSPMVVKSSG